MKILVTGASGLIGSALSAFLTTAGHHLIPLRRGESAPAPRWDPAHGQIELEGAYDAVIHLAGENVAGRWTQEKRRRIVRSRVDGTRLLCERLARLTPRPRVLLCASAIGFYGNRGEEWLVEESKAGHTFLAETVKAWEDSVAPAQAAGIRVVSLRFGIVLTPQGGALAKLLAPFKLGVGGRFGSGKQYWSWVSLKDLIAVAQHGLRTESLSGPVNVVAPNPVTNAQFARTLAKVLKRPAVFPMPAWAIKILLGQMGEETLLGSARVRPARLLATGFQFSDCDLEETLRGFMA